MAEFNALPNPMYPGSERVKIFQPQRWPKMEVPFAKKIYGLALVLWNAESMHFVK